MSEEEEPIENSLIAEYQVLNEPKYMLFRVEINEKNKVDIHDKMPIPRRVNRSS